MKYILKDPAAPIDAVQWTGTNLDEVQRFMAPASPLDHGKDRSELGINAYTTKHSYTDTELTFVKAKGYIMKDARGRFHVFTEQAFEEQYLPATMDGLIDDVRQRPEPASEIV